MVKRCIGIDIGSSYLRAVQVSRSAEEFHIEKTFSTQTRRSTDSPSEILRSLVRQQGFDRRADVAISMPHEAVFLRNLEADFADLQQIQAHTPSVLEDNFPIQPDEIITQIYSHRRLSDDRFSILTAAISRESLQERLNLLAEAHLRPKLVDAAIFAIHSAVVINHREVTTGVAVIAYVDQRCLALAVVQDGSILFVRNIPIASLSDDNANIMQEQIAELLSREVEITWRKVFGAEVDGNFRIYLAVGANVSDGLEAFLEEKLLCQTIIVDPYIRVKSHTDSNTDLTMCVAEGLALRVLAPEETKGLNFLEADDANIKPTLDLRKELVVCAILTGAIAFFWVVGLFMRLYRLETNYAHIENETRELFQNTLPEEKNIVSPLAQLEQKLQSSKKDYQLFASFHPNSLSPLEVLQSITLNRPLQANLRVDDLLIAADTVRVSGTCDSFESVYQWQRLLQDLPGITGVDVQDVQRQPQSGAVHFAIVLSSAGMVPK